MIIDLFMHPKSVEFNPKHREDLGTLSVVTMSGTDEEGVKYEFKDLPFSFNENVEEFQFIY